MTISFRKLWAYALCWMVGDFVWHPVIGGDLAADLLLPIHVMFFLSMVWVTEKLTGGR